jgi:hypothetical protein
MKKTNIFYWIFTGLLAVLMLFSAIGGLMGGADGAALFKHLGYPLSLLTFLSVAKLLGVVAILVPGYPRVREWAYAGFTFDLLGAMYSFIAVGDPASSWLPLIIGLLLIAASYTFYHKKLKAV